MADSLTIIDLAENHFLNPLASPSVQIELLADRREFLPMLAKWHYAQWAYLRPGDTVEARIARLEAACQHRDVPPLVFIAVAGKRLLGSAMLLPQDMDTRPDPPWLSGVFTAPEERGKGVGSALCQHIVLRAAELGFPRIYLYTPDAEGFYARLGWVTIEQGCYKDTAVTIMCYPLLQH
jgi:GNAT superfamily N-acetyltransferase